MHNLEKTHNVFYIVFGCPVWLQSSFINLNTGIVISSEPITFVSLNISNFIVVSYMFINNIDGYILSKNVVIYLKD